MSLHNNKESVPVPSLKKESSSLLRLIGTGGIPSSICSRKPALSAASKAASAGRMNGSENDSIHNPPQF